MSKQKFVVSHLDQQKGPYDEHELQALWSKGDILPIDYVYDEVRRDWMLLTERFTWARAKDKAPQPPPLKKAAVDQDATQKITIEPAKPPTQDVTPPPPKTTKITMVNGLGEIALGNLPPGKLELDLANSSVGLKLQEPHRIEVRPVQPHEVIWSLANKMTAGQELVIALRVVDQQGQVCAQHSEKFVIQIRGPMNRDITLFAQQGQASAKVAHTTAETWTVSLVQEANNGLKLPPPQKVEWLPGPPVRLILDGPHEYSAGAPVHLKVKAVDVYGNVARDFQGTVTFQVKAG